MQRKKENASSPVTQAWKGVYLRGRINGSLHMNFILQNGFGRDILEPSIISRLENSAILRPYNAGTTVVQTFNQGTNPNSGCNRIRVAFFVSFLARQKRKDQLYVKR